VQNLTKLRLTSIGQKLTLIVFLVISLGFGLIVYFYAQQQERNIVLQNERSIHQVLDSVDQGLQSVMITGSADVAELYAERLKGVKDVDDFRILRINGLEAFKDNETVKRVNAYREDDDFELRDSEAQVRVLAADNPHLKQAVSTHQFSYFYQEEQGRKHLTFLLPIKAVKKCYRCHGKDKPVLGVLKFTSSLDAVEGAVRKTWMQAGGVLLISLLAVLVVISVVLKRYIVQPIEMVSTAMRLVAKGDLSQKVPVMGRDELANMAKIFNRMTGDLRSSYDGFNSEHNKLQTIIMGTEEGMVVTDGQGKVVLVNPAAEKLLGKDFARISDEGFLQLFDDAPRMEGLVESGGDTLSVDLVLYNECFLAIGATQIVGPDGKVSGFVAVIRDMTKVKRLEQKLRELASTDALTGLSNRRCLDETLKHEFDLAKAQQRPLSVLMFDVDHFKKFNDNYGHDQGDRVLKAFAVTTQAAVREILDTVCRYGGEEFMVIARETPQGGGLILAERIRMEIEEMRVDGMKVTTSIGVAGILETGAESPGKLIELADAALYRAKEAGRNKVMVAEVLAG
jgi:diguanylate cyclase (GGDEF)-like protein